MLSVRNSPQRERSGNANARDAECLHFCEAGLRRLRRKHSTLSNRFHGVYEKVEAAFDISMTRRVFSETRSVAGLSKGTANRITVRMASRFSCGGQAAYDCDQRSLSIFKTHVLFRRDLRCETKTETPARVVLTFAQAFRIK